MNFLISKFQEYRGIVGLFLLLAAALQLSLVGWEKLRRRPVSLFEPSFCSFPAALIYRSFQCRPLRPLDSQEVAPVDIIWFNTTKSGRTSWAAWPFPCPWGRSCSLTSGPPRPPLCFCTWRVCRISPGALRGRGGGWGRALAYDPLHRDPQLKPITFLVVTMGLIGTLQMFDQVAILGGQAPASPPLPWPITSIPTSSPVPPHPGWAWPARQPCSWPSSPR